jgi:putative flippase GtrA
MSLSVSSLARFREVILFAGVGITNTALDFFVLNTLILLTHQDQGLWLLPFDGLSFLVAVINSYVLNAHFTFRNSGSGDSWRFLRFVMVNALGLVVNSLIVWALSPLLAGLVGLPQIAAVNVSKVLATVVSFCWNYFAIKHWIFRREKPIGVLPVARPVMESEIKSAI